MAIDENALYKSAYDAVVKARTSGSQADIDAGRSAISSLQGTSGASAMGEFSKQLDTPQQSLINQQNATKAPAFDMQGFINNYTAQAQLQAQADQKARDAMIQSRLAGQVADEENNITNENANFVKNTTQTREDVYNAQENNRAQGVQRGIQYSQQQQAIEAGTSLAGEKMIKQAQADRDTRISNIKNKISALRTGASYEMQASQATSQSQVAGATQTATNLATQRQWQNEDSNTAYQRELAVRNIDKQTQVELFNMGEASKEKFFKMDEASKEKFFNMDTERQKIFFDLSEASKEKFWKLDAQQQEKMFSMNAGLQKEMFNLSSAQQVKMLGLEASNQRALASMNLEKQKEMMIFSASLDQKQLDAKIKAEAYSAKAQTLANYIANNPMFSAYPTAKEIAKDPEKAELLSKWMDTTGIPQDKQYELISGQMDSTWWDRLWNTDKKAKENLEQIFNKSSKTYNTDDIFTDQQTAQSQKSSGTDNVYYNGVEWVNQYNK